MRRPLVRSVMPPQQICTMLHRIEEAVFPTGHVGIDERYLAAKCKSGARCFLRLSSVLVKTTEILRFNQPGASSAFGNGTKTSSSPGESRCTPPSRNGVEREIPMEAMGFQGPVQPTKIICVGPGLTGRVTNYAVVHFETP